MKEFIEKVQNDNFIIFIKECEELVKNDNKNFSKFIIHLV